MKMRRATILSVGALCGLSMLITSEPQADAAMLLAAYPASNYDAQTGIWADASGHAHDAQWIIAKPTITTNATPNGSDAVHFSGSEYLTVNGISSDPTTGYTIFAFLRATNSSSQLGIVGGGTGSLEYRIANQPPGFRDRTGPLQEAIVTWQKELNTSSTQLSIDDFSNINLAINSSGGSFRLNGADDGTITSINFGPAAFSDPINITVIGAGTSNNPPEAYKGDIAEIRIYAGVMTSAQRQNVESELYAAYVPEPASLSLLGLGSLMLLKRTRRLKHQ